MDDAEKHKHCTNKFIVLANELAAEGLDQNVVNGGLMTASAVYATYKAAGNDGALNPSGVDKIIEMYRRTLEHHQKVKENQLKPATGS